MVKIAFEPHLESINDSFKKYIKNKKKEIDFIVLNKPRWNDKTKFKIIKMIVFLIKSLLEFSVGKYDLIHINGSRLGLIAYISSFFKGKYIFTIHSCHYNDTNAENGLRDFLLTRIATFLMPIVAKRAIKVYTISYYVANEIKKTHGIIADVIYNGIDNKTMNFVDELPNELSQYKNKRLYISVGRMVECKRPFTVLDVFNCIRKKDREAFLVLIGDGRLYSDVCTYIKNNELTNHVLLVKHVNYDEMKRWYSACKYVISACDVEGFGLAVLEAVSCGCIPILPYRGAFPEIYLNKMYFYDEDNIEAYSVPYSASEDLIKISKKYNWSSSVDKYAQEYIRLGRG